jgi:tRNA-modifying protein YgfZ
MNPDLATPFEREYEALRSGRACFELTDWLSISVTGKDRQSFLHNFCTNDVNGLAPGESCEAFFTNVKGKIVGHGLVTNREREVLILGPPGQAAKLVDHLDRYVIREDVQLTDNAGKRVYILLTGGDIVPGTATLSWDLVGQRPARILELTSLEASSPDSVLDGIRDRYLPISSETFTAARIEGGVPLFGVDFDENNLPQEVGRDKEAISFTKGCYLGQETVARIDALGHVNRRIVGVRFFGDDRPQRGAELTLRGAEVGHVTSVAFSPQLGAPVALAMLRREANAPGTKLESPVGECEVIQLPVTAGDAR